MLPYTWLDVIWEGHAKMKKTKAQLFECYKREYQNEAQAMAESLRILEKNKQENS